jgi:hypothetical protein
MAELQGVIQVPGLCLGLAMRHNDGFNVGRQIELLQRPAEICIKLLNDDFYLKFFAGVIQAGQAAKKLGKNRGFPEDRHKNGIDGQFRVSRIFQATSSGFWNRKQATHAQGNHREKKQAEGSAGRDPKNAERQIGRDQPKAQDQNEEHGSLRQGKALSGRELRSGCGQAVGGSGEDFPAPDPAHHEVKLGWKHVGHDLQAMASGETLSFGATNGVDCMIGLPGNRHHAMAQDPPNGLRRQAPKRVLQIDT